MEKKNNNGILIGLLIGIIIMILIFVGLVAAKTINFNSKEIATTSDLNSYVGEYTYTKEYEEDGVEYTATIDLLENGTFYTSESATSRVFYYGTYSINGNNLILTHLFNTPNVSGMANKINNTVTYTITQDGKITTSKAEGLAFPSNDGVTLTKSSNDCKVEKDFIDGLTNTISFNLVYPFVI